MYAGILFLGLLGFVLNSVFLLVERRALSWHYGTSGHGEH
jgi:ABC-type nitrate/sulfonate/bicarbonate transport system permease component